MKGSVKMANVGAAGCVVVLLAVAGCTNVSHDYSHDYSPSEVDYGDSYQGVDYSDPAFQNADSKVQEDVMIYDILRQQGYSDSESTDAVFNTQ